MGQAEAWRSDGITQRIRDIYEDNGKGYEPFGSDLNRLRKIGAYLPDWYWLANNGDESDGAVASTAVSARQ